MVVAPGGLHLLWLLMLAPIVIGAVLLMVWALGGFRHQPPHSYPPYPAGPPAPPVAPEAPLDILARRFAKGEITAEEYQKARDLLKNP